MASLKLQVEYREGVRIVVGDVGEPGVDVWITDPWDNAQCVVSGSKTEWGIGGFEVVAPHPAKRYVVEIGEDGWFFEHKDGVTVLSWVEEGPPPPPPTPPEPEPPPGPEPPPEPGWLDVKPGRTYSLFICGKVANWHRGKIEGAHAYYVGHDLPGANLRLPTVCDAREILEDLLNDVDDRVERLRRGLAALEVGS